jgi:hypothetical protein
MKNLSVMIAYNCRVVPLRERELCAVMQRYRCGDQAATRRTELKTALRVPNQGQQIEREAKWIEGRKRAGDETERQT